jgi:hypothetical protein
MISFTQKDCNGGGKAKKCYCNDCRKQFKIYIPFDGLELGDFPPDCKFCKSHNVKFLK